MLNRPLMDLLLKDLLSPSEQDENSNASAPRCSLTCPGTYYSGAKIVTKVTKRTAGLGNVNEHSQSHMACCGPFLLIGWTGAYQTETKPPQSARVETGTLGIPTRTLPQLGLLWGYSLFSLTFSDWDALSQFRIQP